MCSFDIICSLKNSEYYKFYSFNLFGLSAFLYFGITEQNPTIPTGSRLMPDNFVFVLLDAIHCDAKIKSVTSFMCAFCFNSYYLSPIFYFFDSFQKKFESLNTDNLFPGTSISLYPNILSAPLFQNTISSLIILDELFEESYSHIIHNYNLPLRSIHHNLLPIIEQIRGPIYLGDGRYTKLPGENRSVT